MLSSHLPLGLPRGLFPSGFPTKTYMPSPAAVRDTCPAQLILLDLITRISFSLCSFLHSAAISFLLGPHIFLTNTFSLCASLNVKDQVPHPHTITSNIIVASKPVNNSVLTFSQYLQNISSNNWWTADLQFHKWKRSLNAGLLHNLKACDITLLINPSCYPHRNLTLTDKTGL